MAATATMANSGLARKRLLKQEDVTKVEFETSKEVDVTPTFDVSHSVQPASIESMIQSSCHKTDTYLRASASDATGKCQLCLGCSVDKMAKRHVKKRSKRLIIREMQIKSTIGCHPTTVRMAAISK